MERPVCRANSLIDSSFNRWYATKGRGTRGNEMVYLRGFGFHSPERDVGLWNSAYSDADAGPTF